MTTEIIGIIIIIALLGYIILLHVKLSRRNIFIETTVKKLSGIEKSRSMDEMIVFLNEIQEISRYSSFVGDKLLEEDIIEFITANEREIRTFIHYTKEESAVRSIMTDGFRFAGSFYKTALQVSKDRLDLKIKHSRKKYFGEYMVVISISKDIINFYLKELEKAGISNYSFENILTEKLPERNDNSDLIYTLPPQFIKGYINYHTGTIIKNPGFDPLYNSPAFMKNIEQMKV